MTAYRCLVVSPVGKPEWRVVEASNEQQAVAAIVADGITPLEVRSGTPSLMERLSQPVNFNFRRGGGDEALLMSQLALLVRAGLPVDRSIDLLRDQASRTAQTNMLGRVLAAVRGGQGLATALETEAVLPSYVIGVIRAAERSGRLGEALMTVAERMTSAQATRRQVVTALTYPAAVLASSVSALVIVLTTVVPQFEPIFAGQEARLPLLTRWVLFLSGLVTAHPRLLLLATLVLPVLAIAILRSPAGIAFVERNRRRIPGMPLRDQYLSAQFLGIFGTLIANGLTVVAALPLVREAIGSRRWRRHLVDVEREVREGTRLSTALARHGLLPSTATRLIEVGERSGQLADSCGRAAQLLAETTRARIERLVALINPLAIVFLGGLVALLVGGVMLGIFTLGDFAG